MLLNLTKQERGVILFLASVALAGMGLDFLSKRCTPIKEFVSVSPNMGKINLNQADKAALINIPGIGEKLAQRILDYRKDNQEFSDLEDLKKIKGITNYRYERLKEHLYLN